jgi:Cys-tRNA(Pro)/Cys-tRNA(Cys) deacylase
VTVIDETAIVFEKIFVSGGRKGYQVGINPEKLAEYINAKFVDIQKS